MSGRTATSAERAISFGQFRLLPAQRLLMDGDRVVRLGSRALDLLVALVEHAGQIVRSDELMARAWPNTTVDEAALRVHISGLRKALGSGHTGARFVTNTPGQGYMFVAPVTNEPYGRPANQPIFGDTVQGNDIPSSLSRIIGRDDIMATLATQLARRRLLTIIGPGGIGKTTVAAAIAETVRGTFAHGVWYVALASLQNPDHVANAVGTVLGVPLSDADPVASVSTWLHDRQALIVLDNCEHLIGAVASIAEAILRSAPRIAILATSREPLRAEGEMRHRLPPLKCPPNATDLKVTDALQYSAVQLFYDRASASMDGFVVDEDNVATIVEICRKLDGLPLALELAAAHVGVVGVRQLAARLDDRLALLVHGRRTALPRQRTMRATLDWSHDLLPQAEQIVLRRLAVFRGEFTIEAAYAVAADEVLTASQVIGVIASLVDKSLIVADVSGEVTCYHLLEITRAYALERLRDSGEWDRASRLHALYFVALFARAEDQGTPRSANESLMQNVRAIDNARVALDWAFSPGGDATTGVLLTAELTPLWVRMSLMRECRDCVERALAMLHEGVRADARTEMSLHAAFGASLTYTTGPAESTAAAWSRTLELAETLGDTEYRLRALRGLWSYRMNRGEHRIALALANQFCELAEHQPDSETARAGDRMAGLILHYLGEQAEARKRIEWTIGDAATPPPSPAARFMLDQRVAAHALLARILWLQGFPDQATQVADSAVRQAEADEHVLSRCHALAQAACPVALWTGDLVAADRSVAMLTELATHNALEGWIARARCFRGMLLIQRGATPDGVALLRPAIEELRIAGSSAEYPFFLAILAHGLASARQIEQAKALIAEAISRSDATGECWCAAELLRIKAEILATSDAPDVAAAEETFKRSMDIAHSQGAQSWELRTAVGLAGLWRAHGRAPEARTLLISINQRFSEGFATADLRAAKAILDEL